MTTWHVDDAALQRWVDGTDGSVLGASVEQHLLTCAECRERVPAPAGLDTTWLRVRDTIELPRPSLLERALRRTGLSETDARIVAVSPAFRAAWLVGLAALFAFVTVAGAYGKGRGEWAFLGIAPLIPALAVALGYDPELDEAIEQECATPYSRLRLVLLRSIALLVVATPLLAVVSALLPTSISWLWLAPAAGCTAAVLALSTWTTPLTSVGAVATTWAAVIAAIARSTTPAGALDGDYLAAYLAAAVGCVLLVFMRRGSFAVARSQR